jgi:hypothetical protein
MLLPDGMGEVPRRYVVPWVERDVEMTGRIDDPLWERAAWSEEFVDILGASAPPPRYRTRMKMLWSKTGLAIAAELEEPHVWATITERDSVIFQDNDFEVFIDPDGDGHLYAEFEINALNTPWDLLLVKPYRAGGPAINAWDIKGLHTAVHIDGTLNDPSDEDRGWTVEILIPWPSLMEIAGKQGMPDPGDQWRINFSRVEWQHEVLDGVYRKTPNTPEDNWVWSPQGVVDMHRPHRWGYVSFAKDGVGVEFETPPEPAILADLYEAQRAFRGEHGRWAVSLEELGRDEVPELGIDATTSLLAMTLRSWHIDHDSRIWSLD